MFLEVSEVQHSIRSRFWLVIVELWVVIVQLVKYFVTTAKHKARTALLSVLCSRELSLTEIPVTFFHARAILQTRAICLFQSKSRCYWNFQMSNSSTVCVTQRTRWSDRCVMWSCRLFLSPQWLGISFLQWGKRFVRDWVQDVMTRGERCCGLVICL